MISIIVALSPNRSIGFRGCLPWNIPEDLHRFKAITMGHTIIMGRKTFNSLPHGALPGRRNIVLSRKITHIPNCDVYPSLQSAIDSCNINDSIFIIGGASVYKEALPLANKLYITLVDNDPKEADTFFPSLDNSQWEEIKKEKHDGFSFLELLKK